MVATLDARLGSQNAVTKGDTSVPPWRSWPEKDRARRCIRFIEDYCLIPSGFGAGRPMRLHPFQKRALRRMLAPGSKSAAWQVCRGNGKSSLIAAMALWAVCDDPDFPVVPIIAGDMKQVERTLLKPIVAMIKLQPEFSSRLHTYRAAGDKRVVSWWNGGEILPLPADVDRLQGLQPTVAIVDEGEVVPWDVYWVLRQGGGKRPGSTILMIGTPGPDLESALYKFRGLAAADSSIGTYLEMAAAPDAAVGDAKAWMAANPAIKAGFLDRDTIAVEARAARLDPLVEAEFRMRRLGQWPETNAVVDPFAAAWSRCERTDVAPSGMLTFSADIGPEDTPAVIVVVGDGVVEVVDQRSGTDWLPDRLAELVDRHGGEAVIDGLGPVGAREHELAQRVPIKALTRTEVYRACMRFAEDVDNGEVRVVPHPALRAAVNGAQRFGQGDMWRWARRRSTVDIAPLMAATQAWWVATTGVMPGIH